MRSAVEFIEHNIPRHVRSQQPLSFWGVRKFAFVCRLTLMRLACRFLPHSAGSACALQCREESQCGRLHGLSHETQWLVRPNCLRLRQVFYFPNFLVLKYFFVGNSHFVDRSMRRISSLGPWFSSFWTVLAKYQDALKAANAFDSCDQLEAELEFQPM